MPVLVTPQITVTGIDTSTALTYLESELAPIVTPYINYLGIPPEDLQAGGLVIGDGLKLGIVASNIGGAIVTEINKAQELIRSSGKTAGQIGAQAFWKQLVKTYRAHWLIYLLHSLHLAYWKASATQAHEPERRTNGNATSVRRYNTHLCERIRRGTIPQRRIG